ncbi:serine hydrolase domain-containing protein [Paremcibacter congregatus]|uniref:Beta-lactamase-related domain-containing protein n=1 Tax=Paremcibacter congregatus TaxID=2043170 RepID=A0A2G4YPA4_9PROT|nr:serine hydrolase domain-containing protein [Paremcibacter congregatus]PHZ84130.1 hypothetical protein CRD36_13105 [Paremcibacter congregatus]QDE25808.1 beta-lactamase family protein [Paremcibacter congregatus]
MRLFLLILSLTLLPQMSPAKDLTLDRYLSDAFAAGRFNGVVLVADQTDTLYRAAQGFHDKARNIALTPNSRFYLASPSKIFTAALILKLVEAEQISLNDSLGKYFPYLRRELGEKITLHHLLSHQSGLPEFYEGLGPDFDLLAFIGQQHSLEEVIAYCQRDLLFPPGQGFKYTDTNYVYLTAIIEKVTGRPYAEVLETYILKPLDLPNTGYFTGPQDNAAQLYMTMGARYTPAPYVSRDIAGGASAIYSTADDLVTFARALYFGDFLQPDAKRLMRTKHAEEKGNFYGYATWMVDYRSTKSGLTHAYYGHEGGPSLGVNSLVAVSPENQTITIILSNIQIIDPEAIYSDVEDILHKSP